MIAGINLIHDDLHFNINHNYGFYKSFGKMFGQNSGAYIFRPSRPNETLSTLNANSSTIRVIQNELMTEVRTDFVVPWIKQVVKIYPDKPHVDIEYAIGPIPVELDGIGKEVVTRFCTNIDSDRTFFTDSNGREFLGRSRSKRPTWSLHEFEPIAGNYYPINAAIYIRDQKRSFAVLTDRSLGGGSLSDGCIEIMLHRRTLYDDARGVGEPINETDQGMSSYPPYGDGKRQGSGIVVDGKYRLVFGKADYVARTEMDAMFAEPILFSSLQASVDEVASQAIFVNGLPKNVHIITLQRRESNKLLIRLAHQYDVNETTPLSHPVRVDLSKLFVDHFIKNIVSFVELTLSGNQRRSDWEESRKMNWIIDEDTNKSSGRSFDEGFVVQLNPLEIRTFELTFG